ncbi:unnamed protein product, partial [Ectocarpus fasciculatus]
GGVRFDGRSARRRFRSRGADPNVPEQEQARPVVDIDPVQAAPGRAERGYGWGLHFGCLVRPVGPAGAGGTKRCASGTRRCAPCAEVNGRGSGRSSGRSPQVQTAAQA